MLLKMFQVDAFTDTLFSGNPAAVFLLDEFLRDDLMQSLAMENNLAETAFVVPNDKHFDLRWFTPAHEVPFCGHATLATAHTLLTHYDYDGLLTFNTREVGQLSVSVRDDGCYELNVPRLEPELVELDLSAVLACRPKQVFKNFENLFAVLDSAQQVKEFVPNLSQIEQLDAGGLVVTAIGDNGVEADFVSRYFAPQAGIPEDPVTGSTHATLVPYWSGVLNQQEMVAHQCSPRGGVLRCSLDQQRVRLAGNAVTFMEANVFLPSS